MKGKAFYQSKTINSAIVIILVALTNLWTLFTKPMDDVTYDTWNEDLQQKNSEQLKNFVLVGGGAAAIYGRTKAKKPIGNGDSEDEE
jgi:hypothetical protein